MKIRGKNIKVLIINLSLIFILFMTSLVILINISNHLINKSINSKLSSIVNMVLKENPNIKKEDIIKILEADEENVIDIFAKYGIDIEEESVILKVEKYLNKMYILVFIIVVIFFLLIVLSIVYYVTRENKKINSITKLINNINNKIYGIGIREEEEDNLSNLRNEIYKTSMMLKMDALESQKIKNSVLKGVADISHQLKTPLASISIMLDNIIEDQTMDAKLRNEYLIKSQNQITIINNLIVSLLEVSRMDAGVINFKREKINVYKLLSDVRESLSINLELKRINLNINCPKNIVIIGDAKWELEAVKNIVKNAIDASFDDSNIDINVKVNNFYVLLSIKDYGKGIERKDIKHIFDRFYKTSEDSKGFGIGLNLAKMIFDQDNALISVKSNKNEGTIFEIKYMK